MDFKYDHVEAYKLNKAYNASLLKTLKNPINAWFIINNQNTEDEDSQHFRIGSAIDCILTTPDSFSELFVVGEVSRPYGLMGKFIDNLPANLNANSLLDNYEWAYSKSGYKMNLQTVVKLMWGNEKYREYYIMRSQYPNKQILAEDEYQLVLRLRNKVLSNAQLRRYFIKEQHTEILFQCPLYFTHTNGLDCKVLIDGIVIDHKEKTVQPYDLKSTIKSVYDFHGEGFYTYGYYIQAALYDEALVRFFKSEDVTCDHPLRKELTFAVMQGYKLKHFEFVVVTKKDDREPALIYQVSPESMHVFKQGTNGIYQLLDDLKWHLVNDVWTAPKKVHESNYVIKI